MAKLEWSDEHNAWVYAPMNEKQKAAQYKPGQSGNPTGTNQHTQALMRINAQKATELRGQILDALKSKITSAILKAEISPDEIVGEHGVSEEAARRILGTMNGDVLRLLTDAEDRGYGKPTQPTRDDTAPRKKITEDMSPEEAADAYRAELESSDK
jgi:hypothetical protein